MDTEEKAMNNLEMAKKFEKALKDTCKEIKITEHQAYLFLNLMDKKLKEAIV